MLLPTSLASCSLRPWTPADKTSLLRHANNRNVWRNLTQAFPHPYTAADADAWFAIAKRPGRDLHLAIDLDGSAIGGIGAMAGSGTACRTCRFGYWLGQEHWGKGIATAAASAFVGHLREHAAFARIEAPVFAWNPASMRVLEKVGFQREGVLRASVSKDGQLIDSVLYAFIVPPH